MPIVCRYYVYCVALPDGGADAIQATEKCTFTYCVTYRMAIRKKETAVSNCRLSVKVAITYSSAFAQDINPVIGMTRFLFSIFDRITIG